MGSWVVIVGDPAPTESALDPSQFARLTRHWTSAPAGLALTIPAPVGADLTIAAVAYSIKEYAVDDKVDRISGGMIRAMAPDAELFGDARGEVLLPADFVFSLALVLFLCHASTASCS